MDVILISTGVFQEYIIQNIEQLLLLDYKVHVITERKFFKNLDRFKDRITTVDSNKLNIQYFNKNTKLDKGFRNGFWNNASKRLFLLHQYIRMNNIQGVIHLENDVLLYTKLDKYKFAKKIYLTMDNEHRCIPGIVYVPSPDLFEKMIKEYTFDKSDMYNMAKFFNDHRDIVEPFPIIDGSFESSIFNKNYELFDSVFDAAAIGQYLGGVDPRNIPGDTTGFVNETCVVKYDKYRFVWLESEGYKKPYIVINNKNIPINNLHIHSKKLKKFIMKSTLDEILDTFFKKKKDFTSNETVANYLDGRMVSGGKKEKGTVYTHICYNTMKMALQELLKTGKKQFNILETGCSSHGTGSTLIWDKFVNQYGGKVISVDKNQKAVVKTNKETSDKTQVTYSDSLEFLPLLDKSEKIDFVYLDCYDVDFMNPFPSADHHWKEFGLIRDILAEDCIILIDDTPISVEWLDGGKRNHLYNELKKSFRPDMSGKGSLVNQYLEKMGNEKIMHQYQVLWKLTNRKT